MSEAVARQKDAPSVIVVPPAQVRNKSIAISPDALAENEKFLSLEEGDAFSMELSRSVNRIWLTGHNSIYLEKSQYHSIASWLQGLMAKTRENECISKQ